MHANKHKEASSSLSSEGYRRKMSTGSEALARAKHVPTLRVH